jgi:hypothetical protein
VRPGSSPGRGTTQKWRNDARFGQSQSVRLAILLAERRFVEESWKNSLRSFIDSHREFEAAPAKSAITHAVNLLRRSGLSHEDFCEKLYALRAAVKD